MVPRGPHLKWDRAADSGSGIWRAGPTLLPWLPCWAAGHLEGPAGRTQSADKQICRGVTVGAGNTARRLQADTPRLGQSFCHDQNTGHLHGHESGAGQGWAHRGATPGPTVAGGQRELGNRGWQADPHSPTLEGALGHPGMGRKSPGEDFWMVKSSLTQVTLNEYRSACYEPAPRLPYMGESGSRSSEPQRGL